MYFVVTFQTQILTNAQVHHVSMATVPITSMATDVCVMQDMQAFIVNQVFDKQIYTSTT